MKPHIAMHDGGWAIWLGRGYGAANTVPGTSFEFAAVAAKYLYLSKQHTLRMQEIDSTIKEAHRG